MLTKRDSPRWQPPSNSEPLSSRVRSRIRCVTECITGTVHTHPSTRQTLKAAHRLSRRPGNGLAETREAYPYLFVFPLYRFLKIRNLPDRTRLFLLQLVDFLRDRSRESRGRVRQEERPGRPAESCDQEPASTGGWGRQSTCSRTPSSFPKARVALGPAPQHPEVQEETRLGEVLTERHTVLNKLEGKISLAVWLCG